MLSREKPVPIVTSYVQAPLLLWPSENVVRSYFERNKLGFCRLGERTAFCGWRLPVAVAGQLAGCGV